MLWPGGHGHRRVRLSLDTSSGPAFDADAAWAELRDRMRAFVGRRVADPHAADDLAQDILLRVHARMGELRDSERLDAWTYRIARNAITDYYRQRAARRETPTALQPDAPELEAVDDQLQDEHDVRAEIASCLRPMVLRLPQPYRDAIQLTDLGDLTQAAAAERAGVTVPGMKARVQRGRDKLRDMLDQCCLVATDRRGAPTALTRPADCGCARAGGPDETAACCS